MFLAPYLFCNSLKVRWSGSSGFFCGIKSRKEEGSFPIKSSSFFSLTLKKKAKVKAEAITSVTIHRL